jgi:hypothetical protein
VENIYKQWEGGITGYEAAPHPHPEAFMVSTFHPSLAPSFPSLAAPSFTCCHRHAHGVILLTLSWLAYQNTLRIDLHVLFSR